MISNTAPFARRAAIAALLVPLALGVAACKDGNDPAPAVEEPPPPPPPPPPDPQTAYLEARRAEAAAMPDPPTTLPAVAGTRQELALLIQLGETLLRQTNTHPMTAPYVGNALTCSSCHRDAGRKKAIASTFIGAAASFPAFNDRDGGVITLQDRVNSCFMRSMNGTRMPENSEALMAIVSYIAWLSQGFPVQPNAARPVSTLNLSFPNESIRAMAAANQAAPSSGASTYAAKCQGCHGADGAGNGRAPPVWGPTSYNTGAGLANNVQAGTWIQFNMPPGEEFTLTDQEALDVAAFVNSQGRPAFVEMAHLPGGGVNYDGAEIVYHYGRSFTAEQKALRVPAAPPDGAGEYAAHCSGCHGVLASSTKRGRAAAQISTAISNVPLMNGLSTLTSAEISAISAALQ